MVSSLRWLPIPRVRMVSSVSILALLLHHHRRLTRAPPRQQQAYPAAYRPTQQPRQPVPVWPSLAPVGNRRRDAHHFPDNKEPQHMGPGAAWSEAGANPGTENRDHDKECRARYERGVRRNTSLDEVAREQARQQRVGSQATSS